MLFFNTCVTILLFNTCVNPVQDPTAVARHARKLAGFTHVQFQGAPYVLCLGCNEIMKSTSTSSHLQRTACGRMLHEKATMELSLGGPLHGPPPSPPLNEYTDVTEDNMVVDPRSDEEDITCDGNGAPAVEDEVIINEENWQEQFEQWMGSWEDYMHGEDGYGTDDSDAEEEIPGDGNDGTNDDGDGTSGGKDGRDVHFYQDHLLDPLFPGCPSRTIDTIFFMLHHKRETRMERSALDKQLHFMSTHLLPEGNYLPPSLHMCKRVLGVEQWHDKQRHVCDADDCPGYVFPKIHKKDWEQHAEDKCKCCSRPRFQRVTRGQKTPLKLNVSWFIDLGLEEAIRSFFDDESFVQQRAKHRHVAPGSYWGSSEHVRMANWLHDNWGADYSTDCKEHSPYDLLLDWLEPYNSAAYSVGVVALR